MSLAELFPDGDYRFHLTLRRSEPREFFAARDGTGDMLAERARWLDAEPQRYDALLPEAHAAVREFAGLAQPWIAPAASHDLRSALPSDVLGQLGRGLEPDLLFLSADPEGRFRLRAGVLCFPTGWALEEKLGHTLDAIHGVVPGLNPALGTQIHQFLSKLKPGTAFLRDNWGIAATPELNLHPARRLPGPDLPAKLEQLWLRVEHQALLALPTSRAIVFGIRIALHPLDEIARSPDASRLRRALATMPGELVGYKRLERIRDYLLNVL